MELSSEIRLCHGLVDLFFLPCVVLYRISEKSQLGSFLQIRLLLKDLGGGLPSLDRAGQSCSIGYFPGWPAHSPGCRWQADSWVGNWGRTQRIRWEICLLLQQGSLDPMCLESGWVRAFRGNVVGLSPSLLSTKASKFCFQT